MAKKGRVFSGARPTGRQHLGNYLGAIRNYVALQDDYECVYCIVDLHALTTVEDTQNLRQNTYEMALDWLAAGIRPDETIVFVQISLPSLPLIARFTLNACAMVSIDGSAEELNGYTGL